MKIETIKQHVINNISLKNINPKIHDLLLGKMKSPIKEKYSQRIIEKKEIISYKGIIKMQGDKLTLFKLNPISYNNQTKVSHSFSFNDKKTDIIKNHYELVEHSTLSQIPEENFLINKKIYEYSGNYSNMKLIIEEVNNKIYDVFFIINNNLDDLSKKDIRLFLQLLI